MALQVASWSSSGDEALVLDCPAPAGIEAGDLLLALYSHRNVPTVPDGWTLVPEVSVDRSDGRPHHVSVYVRVATVEDETATSYPWRDGSESPRRHAVGMLRIVGADPADPLGAGAALVRNDRPDDPLEAPAVAFGGTRLVVRLWRGHNGPVTDVPPAPAFYAEQESYADGHASIAASWSIEDGGAPAAEAEHESGTVGGTVATGLYGATLTIHPDPDPDPDPDPEPGQVTGVTAVRTDGTVTVGWDPVAGAVGYEVERARDWVVNPTFAPPVDADGRAIPWDQPDLQKPSTEASWDDGRQRVTVTDQAGHSGSRNISLEQRDLAIPGRSRWLVRMRGRTDAPRIRTYASTNPVGGQPGDTWTLIEALDGTGVREFDHEWRHDRTGSSDGDCVRLSYTANRASGSYPDGAFIELDEVVGATLTVHPTSDAGWTDTDPGPLRMLYRVRAVYPDDVTGPWSDEVTVDAAPPLPAPDGVTVTVTGRTSALVEWNDDPDVDVWQVETRVRGGLT